MFFINFCVMKKYTLDELISYINTELAIPNNEKVVLCHSKQNPNKIHKFIIITDDIIITLPWRGYPEHFSKGDYIHADVNDIYGLEKQIFSCCFEPVSIK